MNEYYRKISELCAERGISVGKMCADLHIRQSVLSDLKAGRTKKLSTETLSKIATYFGVTMDYLIGNRQAEAVSNSDTANEDQLMAAFFEGGEDLSQEEMEELWADARDYIQYKLAQRRKKQDGQ